MVQMRRLRPLRAISAVSASTTTAIAFATAAIASAPFTTTVHATERATYAAAVGTALAVAAADAKTVSWFLVSLLAVRVARALAFLGGVSPLRLALLAHLLPSSHPLPHRRTCTHAALPRLRWLLVCCVVCAGMWS